MLTIRKCLLFLAVSGLTEAAPSMALAKAQDHSGLGDPSAISVSPSLSGLSVTPDSVGAFQRDRATCTHVAHRVTREAGLPAGLLAAIGRVETAHGVLDGGWPFAVDIDGKAYFPPDAARASSLVAHALTTGARSVDVGCFQVNLQAHPHAFGTLRAAFDPVAGARFAAGLLLRLHLSSGSWLATVADYHSADPARGGPYARRVFEQDTHLRQTETAEPADDRIAVITVGPQQPASGF